MKGKNILLGITGGIAAYKAVSLASKLTASGAVVKTIMTANACEFVTPLTVRSITHQPVITRLFDPEAEIEHISLADWADLLIVAPATANIIGKTASGIADDLLSTTIMATTTPVLFVPAMNVHMYENRIVQDNIRKLSELDYLFLEPEVGNLACGYSGKGRFPSIDEIYYAVETYLHKKKDLAVKKLLITAGATREAIDPMRYLSNNSSGKMGLALARAAFLRGASVKLISSMSSAVTPYYLDHQPALTASDFYEETMKYYQEFDIIIMCAAISDYKPATISEHKIKKGEDIQLDLTRTKDILFEIGRNKTGGQILVGFAAEFNNILENAQTKLTRKNLDYIIANDLSVAGKTDTTVTMISKEEEINFSGSKFKVAHDILDNLK